MRPALLAYVSLSLLAPAAFADGPNQPLQAAPAVRSVSVASHAVKLAPIVLVPRKVTKLSGSMLGFHFKARHVNLQDDTAILILPFAPKGRVLKITCGQSL